MSERIEQGRIDRLRVDVSLTALVGQHVKLRRSGREMKGLCPFHREKSPSFGVVEEHGFFHCFGCGAHGDVVAWVMATQNLRFRDAVEYLERGSFMSAGSISTSSAPRAADPTDVERIERAARLWDNSAPIEGTLAEAYLRWRGITIALPATLRFHPSCGYWDDGTDPPRLLGRFPALIALVENVEGDLVGIWRIYLAADGRGRANVPIPKRGSGVVAGGAVRLGPPGEDLGVTEGVETGLSVMQLTFGIMPVWAALSTSGMRALQLPDVVRRPVLFHDNDQPMRNPDGSYRRRDGQLVCPGLDAARAAEARWRAEGRSPSLQGAGFLKDFNDILRARDGAEL